MTHLSRRRFLQLAGGAAAALPGVMTANPAGRPSLGISLFGSRSLEEGLRDCASIGYENVELHLGPGSLTDPAALSLRARRDLRRRLDFHRLTVSGMSDGLTLGVDGPAHAKNLEAIKVGAQMAHDLYPEAPPPLQTDTGGKSADWEPDRDKLRDRLASWAETAAAAGVVIDVKAHAGNSVDTPQKNCSGLMQRVGRKGLGVNYDYSHFEFTGVSLADSLTALMPYTTFIQVKDARMENGRRRYLLPGEGDIDYAAYFRLLRKLRYSGPVVVEVSVHVVVRPGFDFKTAATRSFAVVDAGRRA